MRAACCHAAQFSRLQHRHPFLQNCWQKTHTDLGVPGLACAATDAADALEPASARSPPLLACARGESQHATGSALQARNAATGSAVFTELRVRFAVGVSPDGGSATSRSPRALLRLAATRDSFAKSTANQARALATTRLGGRV